MISGKNVFDAWLKLGKALRTSGHKFPTRDTQCLKRDELLELNHIVVSIEDPTISPSEYDIIKRTHPRELLAWMDALWLCVDPSEVKRIMPELGFSYAQRIYDFKGINQLDRVIDILKKRPWEWRASISLYDPIEDNYEVPASPPCIGVMDFKIKENRLQMSAFSRAWDIGKKFIPDAINLGLIQKRVAERAGVALGNMMIFVASAHCYLKDGEILQKAVEMAEGR